MTTPTPPSAMALEEAFQIIYNCEHVGYRTDLGSWDKAYDKPGACRICIALALSERDGWGTELSNKKAQITELLRHQNVLHERLDSLQAQPRERERELRDTTTALAAAHHELERTDHVRSDLADRERDVERLREALDHRIVECSQIRMLWERSCPPGGPHTMPPDIAEIERERHTLLKVKALLTRRPVPEEESK